MATIDQDRAQQIRQLVNDCVRRRALGESVTDESLWLAHPHLLPELADELRNLQLVEQAQQQAHGGAKARSKPRSSDVARS